MGLYDKKISAFLVATIAIGTIFVGVFLSAYLGGLPSTTVLHSDPIFNLLLSIFGGALLILVMFAYVFAFITKKNSLC